MRHAKRFTITFLVAAILSYALFALLMLALGVPGAVPGPVWVFPALYASTAAGVMTRNHVVRMRNMPVTFTLEGRWPGYADEVSDQQLHMMGAEPPNVQVGVDPAAPGRDFTGIAIVCAPHCRNNHQHTTYEDARRAAVAAENARMLKLEAHRLRHRPHNPSYTCAMYDCDVILGDGDSYWLCARHTPPTPADGIEMHTCVPPEAWRFFVGEIYQHAQHAINPRSDGGDQVDPVEALNLIFKATQDMQFLLDTAADGAHAVPEGPAPI